MPLNTHRSVAPVVITSSTSMTRWLSTWLPAPVAKAPRTASRRSSSVNKHLSAPGCLEYSLVAQADSFGQGPRSRCQSLCSGTGTTTSACNSSARCRTFSPRPIRKPIVPADPSFQDFNPTIARSSPSWRRAKLRRRSKWKVSLRQGRQNAGACSSVLAFAQGFLDERASAHVAPGARKRRQAIAPYGQRRRMGQQLFAGGGNQPGKRNAGLRMTSFRQPCRNVSPLLQKIISITYIARVPGESAATTDLFRPFPGS